MRRRTVSAHRRREAVQRPPPYDHASDEDARIGRYAEARDRYQKIDRGDRFAAGATRCPIGQHDLAGAGPQQPGVAGGYLSPTISFRNPRDAVRHARRATAIQPEEGNLLEHPGRSPLSGRRVGGRKARPQPAQWRFAESGDSFDWFFLALVELKLGTRQKPATGTTGRSSRSSNRHRRTTNCTGFRSRPPWSSGLPNRRPPHRIETQCRSLLH